MLSSVLTDVMQMLPSAVNSHTRSNKYQYMFVEKLYITPPYEATAVDIWENVKKRINSAHLENLLMQEDLEGLRPVE